MKSINPNNVHTLSFPQQMSFFRTSEIRGEKQMSPTPYLPLILQIKGRYNLSSLSIVIVQSPSHVQLFVTPWTAKHRTRLSFTVSQSFFKSKSIWVGDAMWPSHPLPPLTPFAYNVSQHRSLFQWVNSSHQVAKVLELPLQHQSSNEYSALISFRIDWFDSLAVQGTLKSLLQYRNSRAWILQEHPVFFMVQLLHPSMTTGKTIVLHPQSPGARVLGKPACHGHFALSRAWNSPGSLSWPCAPP